MIIILEVRRLRDALSLKLTTFQPCPAGLDNLPDGMGELRTYYVMQLTLWMWTGVSCMWFEERRKDYVEMMLHHVMTVLLVLNSLLHGELAFGMVVLAVHDMSDVVLDIMKMANYLKLEDSHGGFITEICFVLNTYVSWPYFRLYWFPVHLIPATVVGYHRLCATNGHPGDVWANPFPDIQGWYPWPMLVVLFCLHVFWWYLMNRIALKLVRGVKSHTAGNEEYEYSMKDQKKKE